MKETITITNDHEEDELILYEISQEQKMRILATHIFWSSIVFLIAMLI